ncbi:hypothetical protein MNBD_GAMMA12-3116 [hydrothermal vent metagenome]|uniref:Uncharacterized protein n=1 Tax=hydrothermal vent metagenome TaxID=652676 RepID=A0A3B0Z7R1_9ZZZZ
MIQQNIISINKVLIVDKKLVNTRAQKVNTVIRRHFAGDDKSQLQSLNREAVARITGPGPDYLLRLAENEEFDEGGFGVELCAPSMSVVVAFQEYGQTELGSVTIEKILQEDEKNIVKGWRKINGELTRQGIEAYGAGLWRPFRVASNGEEPDIVTASGVLLLPDDFIQEIYSTGDIAHPLAVLHHELMAHVLPLNATETMDPGLAMELICIRYESEMLRELGIAERKLNWGQDDGIRNQTLHEPSEQYYEGLVIENSNRVLVEINPETCEVVGPAIALGSVALGSGLVIQQR